MTIRTFTIDVPQDQLEDLRTRLSMTRLPDSVGGAGWDYGTDLGCLQELLAYYRDGFDWRAQEKRLNALPHFYGSIAGTGLHFIHVRAQVQPAIPLLLIHGWPDSFLRMDKLIPLLGEFDLVIPSLPGFGFSERPRERGMDPNRIADLLIALMKQLGYARYGAHGGDWGSTIAERLALRAPEALLGMHLTDVPFGRLLTQKLEDPSEAEKKYMAAGRTWRMTEGGYAAIQSSKPQTLGVGLNDSPAGLTCWMVEKFRSWSDCHGDLETRFSKDQLLTNVTLYWVTETIHSACRIYYEAARAKQALGRIEVPTAVAQFPADIIPAPREFAERWFNVKRWNQMPRGGHFAAMEEPELLANDLREFFQSLVA